MMYSRHLFGDHSEKRPSVSQPQYLPMLFQATQDKSCNACKLHNKQCSADLHCTSNAHAPCATQTDFTKFDHPRYAQLCNAALTEGGRRRKCQQNWFVDSTIVESWSFFTRAVSTQSLFTLPRIAKSIFTFHTVVPRRAQQMEGVETGGSSETAADSLCPFSLEP